MLERINRKTDEKLYTPRLHSELVRELHKIKEETKIPMTVLLNNAVREYLVNYQSKPYGGK